jgi:hypothetical protein
VVRGEFRDDHWQRVLVELTQSLGISRGRNGMITHDHNDDHGFDIQEAVDDILDWVVDYAEEHGICPSIASELLAMAAAKSRILTHYQLEHEDDEDESLN